ncbi:hypothetical protein MNBD_ALPHA09-1876 [hydrothermal vent metagenome]|uniref:Uncharacterized protein n=1 Tax=hydrothermal vent metagenome TaxID=652676 RepID=A0A3B0TZT0_9ZZZZ
MTLAEYSEPRGGHPLDTVEHLAALQDWPFDRSSVDEINLNISGKWADYHVSFTWRDELEGLHLACTFDMKVPEQRRGEVARLVARLNEHLWLGHFDLWPDEGMLLFRYGLLLAGGARLTDGQCDAMLKLALETSERYYPSFQYVVWAGKTAEAAMEAALFETVGEA